MAFCTEASTGSHMGVGAPGPSWEGLGCLSPNSRFLPSLLSRKICQQ